MNGRDLYRQAITQRLIPSLRAFNPSLILVSMGFDAARGDVGNVRSSVGELNGERGMNLEAEDFEWVTTEVLRVADLCCNGRVVSVLEGGYGAYNSSSAASKPGRANTRATKSNPTVTASVVYSYPS